MTYTINYLEKRFARLSSLPLCDFIVFDYLNFPFKEDKELVAVSGAPLLSQKQKDGATKEWQEPPHWKQFLQQHGIPFPKKTKKLETVLRRAARYVLKVAKCNLGKVHLE